MYANLPLIPGIDLEVTFQPTRERGVTAIDDLELVDGGWPEGKFGEAMKEAAVDWLWSNLAAEISAEAQRHADSLSEQRAAA